MIASNPALPSEQPILVLSDRSVQSLLERVAAIERTSLPELQGLVEAEAAARAVCRPIETDLQNDVDNCGSLGMVCSSNHILASCAAGVCNGTCVSGFGDCNGNKQTDGCETSLVADPNNCGGCGVQSAVGEDCVNGACLSR